VRTLQVATDFRALLSRQIAHATLRLNGARIELPLPRFASGDAPAAESAPGKPPVEIVSIDEIVLRGVEIVSGGRTLRADIEAVPQGNAITLRKMAIRADDANIDVTGDITDRAGPVGKLALKADTLNFDRLLAFVSDFSSGAGMSSGQTAPAESRPSPGGVPMDVTLSLEAGRASLGMLTLDHLAGRAHITPQGMTLDPIAFGVFKGHYDGSLALSLAGTPDFRVKASVADVDMAAATTFAGSPNTITGRLTGKVDLAGRGMAADAVGKSAHGTVRADIKDGVVKNLGLLRAVVLATSMRADSKSQITEGSRDEPFSSLGGTFSIASGQASTNDLRFESKDMTVTVAGAVALNGSAVNLKGQVQLSEALSQQAGRDLLRYTQEQGRVTLPATVSGSAENLSARIDVGSVAERAIKNRANEEVQKVFKKGLGGFFK
jgi:uncharacterized protein involved in outer membrane biogenesis